jgi:YceI-like domain
MNATPINASAVRDIQNGRWRIDPARSSVEFHVRNLWGLQTVKGRFESYSGTIELATQPSIELTIEADSLNTNNPQRDKHLRSADFFDIANHPHVRFESELVTLDGTLGRSGRAAGRGEEHPDGVRGRHPARRRRTRSRRHDRRGPPRARPDVEPAGDDARTEQADRLGTAGPSRQVATETTQAARAPRRHGGGCPSRQA